MKILIFEYITGGGMIGEPLPAALVTEGELMLNAITRDFLAIDDVEVCILRDHRLQDKKQIAQEFIVSPEFGYGWGFWQKADGSFDGAGWLDVSNIYLGGIFKLLIQFGR